MGMQLCIPRYDQKGKRDGTYAILFTPDEYAHFSFVGTLPIVQSYPVTFTINDEFDVVVSRHTSGMVVLEPQQQNKPSSFIASWSLLPRLIASHHQHNIQHSAGVMIPVRGVA